MQPITFTRKGDDGKDKTRIAYTPAEVVKLRFDGWSEQPSGSSNSTKSSGSDKSSK